MALDAAMISGLARGRRASDRPTQHRSSARREAILQAALRCFNAAGYEWTTIRDICAESGASIGSVYHLFDEKQTIAGALYLDGVTGWTGRVIEAMRAAGDAEAAARGAVHAYVDWMVENPQWYSFCAINRVLARKSSVRRDVEKAFHALEQVITACFAAAAAAGEVVQLSADAYRPLLLGPAYSLMIDRLCRADPDDPPETWLPTAADRETLADTAWRALRR